MPGTRPPRRRSRLMLLATLVAFVALAGGQLARPASAAAGTAERIEADLLAWFNADRAALGLVPLRHHPGLAKLAHDRAATMASTGQLTHSSCLSCLLNARDIQWYGAGEIIAWTTWPWGDQAAGSLYNGWKNSPSHWALLTSEHFNYAGVGVVYQSSTGRTWASIVFTESVDQTNPWRRMVSGRRDGDRVTWTWTGADRVLQTHTAGLKNFDVQYKVKGGSWRTIRSGTSATSLSLDDRSRGYHVLRVRARDHRGNVSKWSGNLRVWVP